MSHQRTCNKTSGREGFLIIYTLKIKRQKSQGDAPYWQEIAFDCADGKNETVATALTAINCKAAQVLDVYPAQAGEEKTVEEIGWECSCLQKKCGACAMIINGRPRLACDAFLKDYRADRPIVLEPLRKFPVVRDLIVDRSVMRENLKTLRAWLKDAAAPVGEAQNERMYDAARCLQCGCCLEVCPSFCAGDSFCGAAGALPVARLIASAQKQDKKALAKAYETHVYSGCAKSLACMDVCPAHIRTDRLLSSTNRLAVWKR